MSILLDALKKSEEQRQLGKTPSIHSPGSEPPGHRGAGRQWIPLALVAAGAIALAWIGWQQYRLPPGLAQDSTPARAQPEAAEERQAGAAAGQQAQAASGVAAEGPADAVITPQPGARLRTPVEDFAAEPPATPAAAVRDPAPPQAKPQPRQARAAAHVTEPISYWELPQGVRDGLPEMRITVLVYAERPQDRFLLISGQRMVEKDTLEGGVVLEEIRRDGAVFQFRTYRFLLKG